MTRLLTTSVTSCDEVRTSFDAILQSQSDLSYARKEFISRFISYVATQGKSALEKLHERFSVKERAKVTTLVAPYFIGSHSCDDKGQFELVLSLELQAQIKALEDFNLLPISGLKLVHSFIMLTGKLPNIRKQKVMLSRSEALDKAAAILSAAGYADLAAQVLSLHVENV